MNKHEASRRLGVGPRRAIDLLKEAGVAFTWKGRTHEDGSQRHGAKEMDFDPDGVEALRAERLARFGVVDGAL